MTLAACRGFAAGASTARSHQGHAFHPAAVIVEAGRTVTWTQEDTDVHTVQFGGAGGFASPALQKVLTFRHTFKSPWNLCVHLFHPSVVVGWFTNIEHQSV